MKRRLAGLNHHHTEIVALKHLVVGFLESVALTLALLGKYACIAFTAVVLVVVAQIYYLNAVEIKVEFLGKLHYTLVVAQQDRLTDALVPCLYGSLEHRRVYAFGKDNALRVLACCII